MIFHETSGAYYETVAAIIDQAIAGTLTKSSMLEIIRTHAFTESTLTIPQKLTDGSWPLLNSDMTTIIKHSPACPPTMLEKRWLKAILQDPRIRLFDIKIDELHNVEPLYTPDQFVFFDQYTDGDPYDSIGYSNNFRKILCAIRSGSALAIDFITGKGKQKQWIVLPKLLEYSSVDDKFRLVALQDTGRRCNLNLSRISAVYEAKWQAGISRIMPEAEMKKVELELSDCRGLLERSMLILSCYSKETEKLDDDKYRILISYREEDETELLIKILGFGRYARVIRPQSFSEQIIERLRRQKEMLSL